jgi:hypothetical protein
MCRSMWGLGCQKPSLATHFSLLTGGEVERWCRAGGSSLANLSSDSGRFNLERSKHILFLQIEDTASPRFKAFFKVRRFVCVGGLGFARAAAFNGGGGDTLYPRPCPPDPSA